MVIEAETRSSGIPVEERFHILERIDGHAHRPDFAARKRVVRVQADLGGKIESYRESRLPLRFSR